MSHFVHPIRLLNLWFIITLSHFFSHAALAETYQDWQALNFTFSELSIAAISGPDATPDHDGVCNLIKYAVGLPPRTPNKQAISALTLDVAGHPNFSFQVNNSATDLTYVVEASTDMTTWERGPYSTLLTDETDLGNGFSRATYTSWSSDADTPRQFFRLSILQGMALPSAWLAAYGLPANARADEDFDQDGLTNGEEYRLGTNPSNPDTDGDGFTDLEEQQYGTNFNDASDGPTPPAERVHLVFVSNFVSASQADTTQMTDVTTWRPAQVSGSAPDDFGTNTDGDLDEANTAYQTALAEINSNSQNILGEQKPPAQIRNGQPFLWSIDYYENEIDQETSTYHHREGSKDDNQDTDDGPAIAAYQAALAALQTRENTVHDVRSISGRPPTQTATDSEPAEGQLWKWSIDYEESFTETTTTTITDYTYNALRWDESTTTTLISNSAIKSLISAEVDSPLDITPNLNAGMTAVDTETARDPQSSQAVYFNRISLQSANVAAFGSWTELYGGEENTGKSARVPVGGASRVWLERVITGIAKFDNETLSVPLLKVRKETSNANSNIESASVVTLTIPSGHKVSAIGGTGGVLQLLHTPPTDHTATGTEEIASIALNCPELYLFNGHRDDSVFLCNASGIECEWKLKTATPAIGTFDHPAATACSFIATAHGKNTIQLVMGGNVVWEKPTEILELKSRADWGALPADNSHMDGTMTSLQGVTFHHSGNTQDGVAEIQRIQRQHMAIGLPYNLPVQIGGHENWGDIAYHFAMSKDGTIYTGRELEALPGSLGGPYTLGSHVRKKNTPSGIGLCILGNYNTEVFTESHQKNLEKVLSAICRRYKLTSDKISYHAARAAVAPVVETTDCPGANVKAKSKDISDHTQENLK